MWVTVSSSGAWDNEMLWQRNIQVILYFILCRKISWRCKPIISIFLMSASQVCICDTYCLVVLHR